MLRLNHCLYLLAALALALPLCSRPATAAAESDPAYAFGTTLVLHSPRQLANPNKTWWGELLPMEYRFSIGSIVSTVNQARTARGVTEMVDVEAYPVNIGGEYSVGGGYEYTIDFQKMLPEDVEVVLAAYPMTGPFADLRQELRPVRVASFWANNQSSEQLTLALPGVDFVISPDENFNLIKERLGTLLEQLFPGRAAFDLSLSRYDSASGMHNFDVSVTIYLDGAESSYNYGHEDYGH